MLRFFDGSTSEKLLRTAIKHNDMNSIKDILNKHAQLLNEPIGSGGSLLHYAVRYGNTQTLTDLLALHCDPNRQMERSKCTALHIAVINAELKKICILLPVTEFSIKDKNGQTPLQIAEDQLKCEYASEALHLKSIHDQWGLDQANWPPLKPCGYGSQCNAEELTETALLKYARDKIVIWKEIINFLGCKIYGDLLNECTSCSPDINRLIVSFVA
ncbi:MAG: hypothetical protein GKR77_01835 [Legionellales bacterium]|nr:hypothetical protein [Legionellales bacterium]